MLIGFTARVFRHSIQSGSADARAGGPITSCADCRNPLLSELMLTESTPLGQNVKRLLVERAAQMQIEAAKAKYGACGVGEIAAMMADGGAGGIQDNMRKAFEWVALALEAARQAPGSEQWPTDEDMAGEIMRQGDA